MERSSLSSSAKRRGIKKRVVEIPMKDVEGTNTPPSDSWAWRKYGQKPIKGSPYPRGYYRCSSSKSCPARKQVERNHVDPTVLLVTYSSDHNHAVPAPRNYRNTSNAAASNKDSESEQEPETEPEERFTDLGEEPLISPTDELGGWLGEVDTITSPAGLECPVFSEQEVSMLGEEEMSLFADLGELPECSPVFWRGRRSSGGAGDVSVGPLVEANCSL
ncbi:WRKY transcription factor [Trifolium repens]|nr:WRKY transcription factor [Trifolium repens]